MKKLKEFFSKYSLYLIIALIILVLVLLILPNKGNGKNDESVLTISLKGNPEIILSKGKEYVDAGYTAYDTKEGDLTSRVIVDGSVDAENTGVYTLKYSITNSKGKSTFVTRTVRVVADLSDVKIDINYGPQEPTNQDVTINLKVSGDGYLFAVDPDGNLSNDNDIKYAATANDEYIFSIKRKDGTIMEEIVSITNIDKKKPTASCKNVVTMDNSTITVMASDESGIKKYVYTYDDKKHESMNDNYVITGVNRNVSVSVYDNVDNYAIVSCVTIDNTWPIFEHQNYVSSTPKHYDDTGHQGNINYIFYYPDDLDLKKKNPLVIYLHGSGEFGSRISSSFNENTAFVNNMRDGKFKQQAFFLAPQCNSKDKYWKRDCFGDLKSVIDQIVVKYNVDPNRISITGHSMGGGATFEALYTYPGFFSAAAPLAPADWSMRENNLGNIKIAVFTGTNDSLYKYSVNDVRKLQNQGVNIKLYPLEGKGHAAQGPTYNETNVIEWLIAQSR